MEKKNLHYFIIIIIGLMQCAQIVPLTGGDKDSIPPKINNKRTFPTNNSINFIGDEIVITFDEYIREINKKDLYITPFVDDIHYNLTFLGNKIIIKFNQKLLTNNTYNLNFSNKIQDITEGNILKNYNYTFSTGDFIDSMRITGKVRSAMTNEINKNTKVFLYNIFFNDSIVNTNKPDYYTIPDENGYFEFNNLKYGKYKLFSLVDKNQNLKYDIANEEIGFIDSLIIIQDNKNIFVDIFTFIDKEKPVIIEKKFKNNYLELSFSSYINDLQLFDMNNNKVNYNNYSNNINDYYIFLHKYHDSIILKCNDKLDTIKNENISYDLKLLSIENNKLDNELIFNKIINKEIINNITISLDSIIVNIDSLTYENNKVFINNKYKSLEIKYLNKKIDLPSNNSNKNSSLIINLLNDTLPQIILELLNEKDEILDFVVLKNKKNYNFAKISASNYKIRAIIDQDGNGRWTSGNYYEKKQAEKVIFFPKILKIKENWESKEDWKLEF